MRTLKKTLSLLLAVALVLSLTVVGASAYENKVDDFGDVAEIGDEYLEAVGVMSGLGIIEGYDDGNFKPATSYTREQAAKIIAYMQLGPDAAEKLACTVSPFTDVDAGRWSAGYIAYAKDAGILDGMGDGSFDPTGTLTGFQWAKMLLCAVGYGENGEFTGSEWSINTAKVAQTVKLFAGDLTGMTNGVINREQAVLYAFNTLTTLGIVVYSPALGDYIFSYNDKIFDRVTPEGTLGGVVYGLKSVKGIIIDNEGMGADKTVVSVTGSYSKAPANAAADKQDVSVSADTDLDMMYHAAKIWYTGSGAVYVMDLATVESLTCHDITGPAVAKLERGKTVTDKDIGARGALYEYNLIDNTAIGANYAAVDFYYILGTLGVRSTVKDTTVVDRKAYANSDILTDISKINQGDRIIYIATKSTTSTGEASHVYAVTYTTGKIVDWSRVNQTITLEDGTVIKASVFAADRWYDNLTRGNTATISLDTHGHFIDFDAKAARVVAYYTGTVRNSTPHDAWYSDAGFAAQFAELDTGKEFEVPVTADWVFGANSALAAGMRGYYDITDSLLNTGNYEPEIVNEDGSGLAVYDNDDYSSYAFKTVNMGDTVFNATSYRDTFSNGNRFYYDPDTVTFIIASGVGSTFDTEVITGVDNLLAKYSELFPANSVTLEWLGMTGYYDDQDVFYANTIFAFTGATISSGTIFFPYDLYENDMDPLGGGLYRAEGGILNGSEEKFDITVNRRHIERGFYTFTVDPNGLTSLNDTDYHYGPNTVIHQEGSSLYYVSPDNGVTEYNVSNAKVIDLRLAAEWGEVDTVADLSDLYFKNTTMYDYYRVNLAYAYSAGSNVVSVIYVLDDGFENNVIFTLGDTFDGTDWRVVGGPVEHDWNTTDPIEVDLYNPNVDLSNNPTFVISATSIVGGSATATAKDAHTLTVSVTPSTLPSVNEREVVIELNISSFEASFGASSDDYGVWVNVNNQDPVATSDTVVPGEPVKVTLTATNAAVGFAGGLLNVEFTNNAVPGSVLTSQVNVAPGAQSVTVTVYPVHGALYELSDLSYVD